MNICPIEEVSAPLILTSQCVYLEKQILKKKFNNNFSLETKVRWSTCAIYDRDKRTNGFGRVTLYSLKSLYPFITSLNLNCKSKKSTCVTPMFVRDTSL